MCEGGWTGEYCNRGKVPYFAYYEVRGGIIFVNIKDILMYVYFADNKLTVQLKQY